MPIRPQLRKFYRGAAWRATRMSVLARAKDCCERCGKPNGKHLWVLRDGTGRWCLGNPMRGRWYDGIGKAVARPTADEQKGARFIRVVLTIAHLNHLAGDDRDENLQALCQRCHLAHDQAWHAAQARRTRAARAGQGWLIDAALPASIEDVA